MGQSFTSLIMLRTESVNFRTIEIPETIVATCTFFNLVVPLYIDQDKVGELRVQFLID